MDTLDQIKSQIIMLNKHEIFDLIDFLKNPKTLEINSIIGFNDDDFASYNLAESSFAEEWNDSANDVWDNV